jgi:hypothetical protein
LTGPSPEEMASFGRERDLFASLVKADEPNRGASLFACDCDALIAAYLDNAQRANAHYLPIASLLRLARRIGTENIRYIEALFRPESSTLYRLQASIRSDVLHKRQRRRRRAEYQRRLEYFGSCVLGLESRGLRRWPALERAGNLAKLYGSSRSYLQQKFREFEALSRSAGYVRTLAIGTTFPPRFNLRALKAREGRSRKN